MTRDQMRTEAFRGIHGLAGGHDEDPPTHPDCSGSSFAENLAAMVPQLRAYARCLARDPDAADDLVQDTVMLALRARARFRPGTNLQAWLITILRNRFCGMVVRRRTKREVELTAEDLDQRWGRPPTQDAALEVRAFRLAFARLTATHREVLVLLVVHGLSYQRIARVCGCEVGTVKSRTKRARATLKAMLFGEDEAPRARTRSRGTDAAARCSRSAR